MVSSALLRLHLSILIAGFTGILGKLIELDSFVLSGYRSIFTAAMFFCFLLITKNLIKIPAKNYVKIIALGTLLGIHWIFFYGSIKFANVSIAVICLSSMGFFTSLLEPLLLKRKLQIKEIIYSLISILGILFIFKFDSQYRLGIIIGFISAFLASTYTILNKKFVINYDVKTLLLYEMLGSSIFFIFCTPFYVSIFSFEKIIGTSNDYIYLLLLSSVCTIGLYLLQISVVKVIFAFTVNLSYNLEPIYSIILAMIIFKEGQELNFSFYIGLILIILSVALQTISSIKK